MTKRSTRLRLLALVAAVAVFVAACGDDDNVASNDDSSSETDGESNETENRAEDAVSDQFADQLGEKCGFLAEFVGVGFEGAFDPSAAMTGETFNFSEAFAPIAKEFQEVAAAAPDEIQDAFQTMADGFDELVEQFEDVEVDFSDPQNIDPEALEAFDSIDTAFDSDELNEASEEIEAWIGDNCEDAEGLFGEGGPFGD